MSEKIDAWWFAASDRLPHGDGRVIVVGEAHSVTGQIILCKNALHASRHPFDALRPAPGPFLYRVRCWGDVVEDTDKLGARHREYLAMRDATAMLRQYARERALSVIHLWDAPDVVRRYLETGDETIRDAAARAASDAWAGRTAPAWPAAAARAATWDVARAAAWDVAWVSAINSPIVAAKKRFGEMVAELFEIGEAVQP